MPLGRGDAVEHEIQRLMLERLSIEWTPGEPFYSLIEAEIERLTHQIEEHEKSLAIAYQYRSEQDAEIERLEELNLTQARRIASDYAENERLRAALMKHHGTPDGKTPCQDCGLTDA